MVADFRKIDLKMRKFYGMIATIVGGFILNLFSASYAMEKDDESQSL